MIASAEALLEALAEHAPVDAREGRSLARIRALLHWLPSPFDEDADPAHVTASGIVVDQDGRLLLHQHRRLGIWLQPGGHVDTGESLVEAVEREVIEETGLAASCRQDRPFHVDLHEGPRGHVHLDIRWLMEADGTAPLVPGPDESPHVAWYRLDEVDRLADDGLRGAVARLRADSGNHQTAL